MLFFRNLLKLPSPVDLGWSKTNALESAMFSDDPKGKTWEDWHKTVKEMHPVKYWLAETAPNFVRYNVWLPVVRPIETLCYWLVSHLIPSRRYHMLDLRQPYVKDRDCYRYGWQDVPEKMLYAMFNLLGEYLNKEKPEEPAYYYTREQIEADVHLKAQQDSLDEANAIYYWWSVVRHEENALSDKLFNDYWKAKENKADNVAYLRTLYLTQERINEVKVEEMADRLLKIRKNLWT